VTSQDLGQELLKNWDKNFSRLGSRTSQDMGQMTSQDLGQELPKTWGDLLLKTWD
jgi:hypothetical protein